MEVTVKYSESPGSSNFVYGYQLDRTGYANMLATLGDEQLIVESYDSTSLTGHIDVKEDGLLFFSIPYAEGWTATVDGEEAEIVSVQDALMGIRLGAGHHDVKIAYVPAGFKEGLLVSVTSLLFIAILAAVPFIPTKKKAAAVSGTAAEPVIEEVPVSEIMSEENKAEDNKAEEKVSEETKEPAKAEDKGESEAEND